MVESKIRDPNRRSMEGLRKFNPGLKLPIPARDSAPPHPLPLPLPLPLPPLPSGTVPCKLPCPPADGRDVALEDLIKLEPLGQGNGGKVYKVQHKVTKAFYALKIIQDKHDPAVRKHIIKEIQISRRFCAKSQHVVQCYGVSERGGEISLILEYMDGGTLQQALSAQKKISEAQLAEATRQVLKGLRYLHSNKIVHRDIKPSNLLMNRRKEVKIADFGVSTELAHTLAQCDSFVGTYAYMSPERWDPDGNGGHYDCSADIWSLGLTLLECAVGHFPCLAPGQKADWPTLMWAICMGDPPSPPADSSPEFRSFIKCCLHKDAVRRPSAAALLNHPFLKKYENQHSSLSPLLSSLHL